MYFDTIIQNGNIIDGTGKLDPFPADIGISGEQISAVGNLKNAYADQKIDATSRMVSPGFIDVHVHSEIVLLGGRDRFAGLKQGVTTQLLAPDGFGWACLPPKKTKQMWEYTRFIYSEVEFDLGWPTVENYFDLFHGCTPANVYPQIPHCAIRLNVMGWEPRPASNSECDAMIGLVRNWLEAGAGVICLGLDYQPSVHSDFRELVAICKVVASYGGIYAAHQRYQTLGRKAAWEETLALSQQSNIPVHVSHERVDKESAALLEKADQEGIDLTFESYLYPAGMTHLTMMLPIEIQTGSLDTVLHRLKDSKIRKISLPHLKKQLGQCNQIVGYTGSGRFIGLTLKEAAKQEKKPPEVFAYDLILEEEGLQSFVFPWQISQEEASETVERTAYHPKMMIASDGVFDIPHPHPRGYGCFARVLGHFVREKQLLSLRKAIYKMSGFPAQRFGLKDRGEISKGKAADLVIFNPKTIEAQSTFQDPICSPIGIDQVLVNGKTVIKDNKPTGCLPGRVLRHQTT